MSLQPEEPRSLAIDAEAAALAAEAEQQLREYLAGTRRAFDLTLDLSSGSAFQQATWRATCTVPFGLPVAYGEIAAQLGQPQAARAVGQALKRNPLLILVPCHRVVRMHGGLGGFRAGDAAKVWLLKHEGALLL
ncbi:MAG: methylated-DNA--[protein]-cysteine S-methyltransferase [Anaerolineales bacterium]